MLKFLTFIYGTRIVNWRFIKILKYSWYQLEIANLMIVVHFIIYLLTKMQRFMWHMVIEAQSIKYTKFCIIRIRHSTNDPIKMKTHSWHFWKICRTQVRGHLIYSIIWQINFVMHKYISLPEGRHKTTMIRWLWNSWLFTFLNFVSFAKDYVAEYVPI